jgi:hypothetical protein
MDEFAQDESGRTQTGAMAAGGDANAAGRREGIWRAGFGGARRDRR